MVTSETRLTTRCENTLILHLSKAPLASGRRRSFQGSLDFSDLSGDPERNRKDHSPLAEEDSTALPDVQTRLTPGEQADVVDVSALDPKPCTP